MEKKNKVNLVVSCIKGTQEVKLCFKASLAVAEGEFPQVLASPGEQFHGEAGGTCITELGVPWKIYEMRMGLKISDGCVKIATFTSENFEVGALPWDPVLKSVEVLAVTHGPALWGMYKARESQKTFLPALVLWQKFAFTSIFIKTLNKAQHDYGRILMKSTGFERDMQYLSCVHNKSRSSDCPHSLVGADKLQILKFLL